MKYLIILIFFSSCSAQWHFKRAYDKNPGLFKVDTTKEITYLQAPTVKFKLDTPCITRPIEFFEIREYQSKGLTIQDTIFVRLKPDTIEVECDPVVITESIPEPYPVEVEKPLVKSVKLILILCSILAALILANRLIR